MYGILVFHFIDSILYVMHELDRVYNGAIF
jgi:hypothetical protein